jgi:DNA-binding LytR/AlgR family response regulator
MSMEINYTVLIVEDQAAIAIDIEQRLCAMGCRIAGVATNAREAREVLENGAVDMILLDINLGEDEEDGIQLAATVKHKHIPCIFLTAFSDSHTFSRALQVAPAGYLVKPFRNDDLKRQLLLAAEAHRQIEHEKKASALMEEALFDTTTPAALLDSGKRIIRINREMEKLSGFTSVEMQGRPAAHFFRLDNDTLSSITHRNGQPLALCGNLQPSHNNSGQLIGYWLHTGNASLQGQQDEQAVKMPAAFFVREKGQLIRLAVADIFWLEAVDNYTRLHTRKGRFMVKQFLKDMMQQLPHPAFVRIHRSFAVALTEINSLEGDTLYISQQALPVGKQYRNELLKHIAIL